MLRMLLLVAVLAVIPTPSGLIQDEAASAQQREPPPTVEEVATGLRVPWAIDFAAGGLFFTQQPCHVVSLNKGTQVFPVPGCVDVGDGVRGIALRQNPDPATCLHVYLAFTYARPAGGLATRVSRFTIDCTAFAPALTDERVLLENIPGGEFHTAGRLKFGPDGMLYLATGDALVPGLSQDPSSLAGKILRFTRDGSVPAGNPISGSYVYALGLRNPQGLAWHPLTGDLWATDHGPSPTIVGEPYTCCHDEINRTVGGGNYGWPFAAGVSGESRFVDPALESGTATWAPAGAAIYHGPGPLAPWDGSFLYGALIGEHLGRVTFAGSGLRAVSGHEKLLQGAFGRIREVVQGPDGYLYLTTSNTDGRSGARARPGDDRILRVVAVPTAEERRALVRAVYLAVLGREPEPGGWDGWAFTHYTREALQRAFEATTEGQRVRAVRSAYQQFLLRDPLSDTRDVAGLRSWVESGIETPSLTSGIAGSVEAHRIATIRAWYLELFGRDPVEGDLPGLRFWVDGGLPLEEVRQALVGSEEYER